MGDSDVGFAESGNSGSGDLIGLGGGAMGETIAKGGTGGVGIISGSSLKAARTIDRRPFEGLRPKSFSVSVRFKLLAEDGAGDLDDCAADGSARLLAIGGGCFDL